MFIVIVSDGKCKTACLYAVGLGFCGGAEHWKSNNKHIEVMKISFVLHTSLQTFRERGIGASSGTPLGECLLTKLKSRLGLFSKNFVSYLLKKKQIIPNFYFLPKNQLLRLVSCRVQINEQMRLF